MLREALLEEIQRRIALGFRHTDESSHEARVDKHRLDTRDGVYTDDGMNRLDRLAEGNVTIGITRGSLVVAGVQGGKGFEV